MRTKNRTLLYLCTSALVILVATTHTSAATIFFYSLYDTGGGNYETDPNGKYVVYEVGLHTIFGDFTEYAAGTNCGQADHKPGSADWPQHYHVHRSNDSYPWTAALFPDYVAGSKAETKKYYEVMLLNNGGDSAASEFARDDSQDDDSQHGDPNFVNNCYGYAFHKSGVEDYNDVLLYDGSTGADRVVSSTAALYDEYSSPSDTDDDWIMYMAGTHANYVSDISTNHCDLRELKFKTRCSQIFQYDYDAPGRDTDDDFWGFTSNPDPSYYKKEP